MIPQPKDHDRFRNLLAFLLIGAFIFVLPLLIYKTIPVDNKEIITYMLGQLSGMATTAVGFYLTVKAGQDALDNKRSETTGKLADAVVAAANSTPAGAETVGTMTVEADTVNVDRNQ